MVSCLLAVPPLLQGTSTYPSYNVLSESALAFAGENLGSPIYLAQTDCSTLPPNISIPLGLPSLGVSLNISESEPRAQKHPRCPSAGEGPWGKRALPSFPLVSHSTW